MKYAECRWCRQGVMLLGFLVAFGFFWSYTKGEETSPQNPPAMEDWTDHITINVPKPEDCNLESIKKIAADAVVQWVQKNPDKLVSTYEISKNPCSNTDQTAELIIEYVPVAVLEMRPLNPDTEEGI